MACLIAAVMIALTFVFPLQAQQNSAEGPRRIVSLYPGHSENIVALGAGDRLVALSRSDDRDLLPHLPRLTPKVNREQLLSLAPDLVVVRTLVLRLNPALERILGEAGIPLLCLDPPLWDEFDSYLRTLAEALAVDADGALKRAGTIRKDLACEAARRRGDGPRPRVFLEATADRLHTCAPGSWAAHLIALAGGENIASEEENPTQTVMSWGVERLLESARSGLDVYLLQQGTMNRSTVDDILRRPWMKVLKNVRVETIQEGILSRPSLLGLERGGRRLLDIFYPPRRVPCRE